MMKKLLLLAIISATLLSCKKDKGDCYHCTFGNLNGYTPAPKDYCGTPPDGFFEDAQGNDYSYHCVKKN